MQKSRTRQNVDFSFLSGSQRAPLTEFQKNTFCFSVIFNRCNFDDLIIISPETLITGIQNEFDKIIDIRSFRWKLFLKASRLGGFFILEIEDYFKWSFWRRVKGPFFLSEPSKLGLGGLYTRQFKSPAAMKARSGPGDRPHADKSLGKNNPAPRSQFSRRYYETFHRTRALGGKLDLHNKHK